jgi:hypothetical protein
MARSLVRPFSEYGRKSELGVGRVPECCCEHRRAFFFHASKWTIVSFSSELGPRLEDFAQVTPCVVVFCLHDHDRRRAGVGFGFEHGTRQICDWSNDQKARNCEHGFPTFRHDLLALLVLIEPGWRRPRASPLTPRVSPNNAEKQLNVS